MAGHVRDDAIGEVLATSPVVAVLGAHPESWRPAHYVPDYLHRQGYRVLPVNPRFAGQVMWGEPVRATLAELDVPVDLVDIFRPSAAIPSHLPDILAMRPLPRVVWMQQGIWHDAAAEALIAAGIDVVQDRCTLADHRALRLGPPRVS